MIWAAAVMLAVGAFAAPAVAQAPLPANEVTADTYIGAFPETGARIAVFEAGMGFREELFARDTMAVFDSLQPGQPPLAAADIIVARVASWAQGAEVYDATPLQSLSDEIAALPSDRPVHIQEAEIFGGMEVLTFTFLNEAGGEVVHARCMARLVIDTLYTGTESEFDLVACSHQMN